MVVVVFVVVCLPENLLIMTEGFVCVCRASDRLVIMQQKKADAD